jgi:hypothetical protein
MRLYHIYIHKKVERSYYLQQRKEEIKKLQPAIAANELNILANLTRGKGQQDFVQAVHDFAAGKQLEKTTDLRSNTCDCIIGVWIEHLLTKKEYTSIINEAGFTIHYTAGYWDTHYSSALKNKMAAAFNKIIAILGKEKGIILSPFVNVVALNKA